MFQVSGVKIEVLNPHMGLYQTKVSLSTKLAASAANG
jgi:hypothetical protein